MATWNCLLLTILWCTRYAISRRREYEYSQQRRVSLAPGILLCTLSYALVVNPSSFPPFFRRTSPAPPSSPSRPIPYIPPTAASNNRTAPFQPPYYGVHHDQVFFFFPLTTVSVSTSNFFCWSTPLTFEYVYTAHIAVLCCVNLVMIPLVRRTHSYPFFLMLL